MRGGPCTKCTHEPVPSSKSGKYKHNRSGPQPETKRNQIYIKNESKQAAGTRPPQTGNAQRYTQV
jgi:hypothetical protein